MKRRHLLPLALLSLLPACTATPTGAAHHSPEESAELNPANAPTPAAAGTLALIKLQNADGSFNGPANGPHAGITALAGLALLSASDVAPSTITGPIQRAVDFILRSQRSDGYIYHEGDGAGMYGHAFATLFLTQLYATTSDEVLKAKVEAAINKAVQLLERAQNREGGWRYQPVPADADVSVTAAEVKALAAARDVGIKVPDIMLNRAVSYLKSNQQPDGGFSYTLSSGASGWARSAAATAAILYASTTALDTHKALAYLKEPGHSTDMQYHFYYGNYYFSQALNLDPGKTKSAASLRDAILARQSRSSYLWSGEAGDAYATSIALIILYMPYSHLPAFQPPVAATQAAQ